MKGRHIRATLGLLAGLLALLTWAPAHGAAQDGAGPSAGSPASEDAASEDAASEGTGDEAAGHDAAPEDAADDASQQVAVEDGSTDAPEAAEDQPSEEEESVAVPDVAVLSVGGDANRAQARRARQAVALALSAEGMTPVADGDVALRVPPAELSACQDTACAYAFASRLSVRMVAAVTTWAGEDAPSSVTVSLLLGRSRSYSATEDVGSDGLQRAATRAVRGAQEARRQELLVSGVSAVADDPDDPPEEQPGREETFLNRDRPLEQWVLPSLLGVVGLGLVGAAVYALLDEQCERTGASGVCLRGNSPNYGLGVLFVVTGALSIGGALLWLIVGGEPANAGGIDVVFGPDGGGVTYRGRF